MDASRGRQIKPFLKIDRKRVRKHWGKTDSEVSAILKELKLWTQTKDLPEIPTDNMLEFFVTNCKYNIEQTKKNILTYYSIRREVPEIYRNSNPRLLEMQQSWNTAVYCPLPDLTDDMNRLSICKINPNSDKFCAIRYTSNFFNVYEVRICEDLFIGEVAVCDLKHLKWGHVFKFSPFLVPKIVYVLENVAKNRVKQINIINAPYYVTVLVNIFKKCLKKKIGERIQIHSSLDSLYECVPQDALPSDYGGKAMSLNKLTRAWRNHLRLYQDRFDMLEKSNEN